MKRLLSILSSIGLVATSASSVVSCDDGESAHKFTSSIVYSDEFKTYGYNVSYKDTVRVTSNNPWEKIKPAINVFIGNEVKAKVEVISKGDISQKEQEKLVEHNGDNESFQITFPITVFVYFTDSNVGSYVVDLLTKIEGSAGSAHTTIELPSIVNIGGTK